MSRRMKSAVVVAAGAVPLLAASGAAAGSTATGAGGHAPSNPPLQFCPNTHDSQPPGPFANYNSGKLLEVYHSSKANGATVDQWSSNGTNTQLWCIYVNELIGNVPAEKIVNYNSNKCLEVYHSATGNGGRVDQWTCNGTNTQEWIVKQVGLKNDFAYVNLNSGKCLEVYHSATENGARVDQWTCNGTKTQDWGA